MLVGLSAFVGCNKSLGPTSGRVRFDDGSPVQAGRIEFRDLGDGSRYTSRIEPNGRFHPENDDGRHGLPPGQYEVVVVQMVLTEDLATEDHHHGLTVPRRYADYHTSDLRTRVTEDQTAEVEIVLEAD
jgi:hypothetical protein